MTVIILPGEHADPVEFTPTSTLPPAAQLTLGAFSELIRNALIAPDVDLRTITARDIADSLIFQGIPESFIIDQYPNECFAMIKRVYEQLSTGPSGQSAAPVGGLSEGSQLAHLNSTPPSSPEISASPSTSEPSASPGTEFCFRNSSAAIKTETVTPLRVDRDVPRYSVEPQPATAIDNVSERATVDLSHESISDSSGSQLSNTVGSPARKAGQDEDTTSAYRAPKRSKRPSPHSDASLQSLRRSQRGTSRSSPDHKNFNNVRRGVQAAARATFTGVSSSESLVKSWPPSNHNETALPTVRVLPKLVISSSTLAAVRQRAIHKSDTTVTNDEAGSGEAVKATDGGSVKRAATESDDEEDEFAASFIRKRKFVL